MSHFARFALMLSFTVSPSAQAADLGQAALKVFESKCAQCHGPGSSGEGGLDQILNLKYLAESPDKYVVPGNPEQSEIYIQILSNDMPYKNPPLSAEEKAVIRDWIQAGAPLPAGPEVQRLSAEAAAQLMEKDLASVPSGERRFQRYFSFLHLQNLGTSPARLATFRQGLVKLLNSLSTAPKLYAPVPVAGARDVLFRVNLRALNWTQEKWTALERSYPYFIQRRMYEKLQAETKSLVPLLQADWFAKFGSIEPLYSVLLGHPDSSTALETRLGINLNANVHSFVARRAGFSDSGVSLHNRVIERHPLKTYPGYYWISYDFNSSFGAKDVRANPFGPIGAFDSNKAFQHDGGEIIYQLPNGLHGYMLVNNKGKVLAEAPINIVKDSDPRRPVIVNGVSCMSCHSQGLRDKNFDVVYDNAVKSQDFSPKELKALRALYATKDEYRKLYDEDNRTFLAALKEAKIDLVDDNVEQVNQVSYDFEGSVRLERAAETLEVSPEELKDRMSRIPALRQLLAQLEGTGVSRDTFLQAFVLIASKLGLGQPLNSINLEEAIRAAKAGSTLTVPAGLYVGDFEINKSLTLVGQGQVDIQGSIEVRGPGPAGIKVRLESLQVTLTKGPIYRSSTINIGPNVNLDVVKVKMTSLAAGPYYNSSNGLIIRPENFHSKVTITDSVFTRLGELITCFVSDMNKETGSCQINVKNTVLGEAVTAISMFGPSTSFLIEESTLSELIFGANSIDNARITIRGCQLENVTHPTSSGADHITIQ